MIFSFLAAFVSLADAIRVRVGAPGLSLRALRCASFACGRVVVSATHCAALLCLARHDSTPVLSTFGDFRFGVLLLVSSTRFYLLALAPSLVFARSYLTLVLPTSRNVVSQMETELRLDKRGSLF